MKKALCLIALLCIASCNNKKEQLKKSRLELLPEPDKELTKAHDKNSDTKVTATVKSTCFAVDFIALKNKDLQKNLFKQLDSIIKIQYPNNNQELYNSVDLTPKMLNQFLKDIDLESLEKNDQFEQFYNFNISHPNFKDSPICRDQVAVLFLKENCRFRITIDNVYMVEGDCIGGSQVIYGFQIKDSEIIDFWRDEAG